MWSREDLEKSLAWCLHEYGRFSLAIDCYVFSVPAEDPNFVPDEFLDIMISSKSKTDAVKKLKEKYGEGSVVKNTFGTTSTGPK